MTRLQSELHRLFELPPPPAPQGRVRALGLALARPADWEALAAVWRGVQADLALPAPAIAVSGTDGYQLWFSLAEPIPVPPALAFLEALRSRYLGDIAIARVGMLATADPILPPMQLAAERWSAFVAPDLAPVFADEPWLDTPPSPEGQADLLARLQSIRRGDFEAALLRLVPNANPAASAASTVVPEARPAAPPQDPKQFLLGVMNDDSVALPLRIDAAKALLPWCEPPRDR